MKDWIKRYEQPRMSSPTTATKTIDLSENSLMPIRSCAVNRSTSTPHERISVEHSLAAVAGLKVRNSSQAPQNSK